VDKRSSRSSDNDSPQADKATGDRECDRRRSVVKRLPTRGEGDPTTGIGLDRDGNEVTVTSGYDDVRQRARDLCNEKGWPDFRRTHHVEIKFAMMMRARGLKHATLYINRKPYDDMNWNCDKLLPRFLPPGSTLKIFGPDGYEKLFEAKEPGG
jgi:hypothetical protein